MFRHNLPPALLAEWPVSFTRQCGNTGMEWTLNKSLLGFKLATFRSCPQRSYQEAVLAILLYCTVNEQNRMELLQGPTQLCVCVCVCVCVWSSGSTVLHSIIFNTRWNCVRVQDWCVCVCVCVCLCLCLCLCVWSSGSTVLHSIIFNTRWNCGRIQDWCVCVWSRDCCTAQIMF